jgi:hypothetical protein
MSSQLYSKNTKDNNKFAQFIKSELIRLNSKTKISGNKRIITMDINNDGKVDSELIYINNKLFKEQLDFNYDGTFDKIDWYFMTGELLQTTTIDSNYDGQVDIKIIKTLKGASAGYIKRTKYRDKDFDGKFDSKITTEFAELQSQSTYQNEAHVNCALDDYQEVHLPAIIDNNDQKLITDLEWAVKNRWEPYYDTRGLGQYNFKIQVQKSCQQEGAKENQDLFANSNIQESLKKGVTCMGQLNDTSKNPQSSVNFRKVIAGLTGYDHNGSRSERHNNPLRLVCKLEKQIPEVWNPPGETVYAMATTSNRISSNNSITNIGEQPPLIIFRPKLAKSLEARKVDYKGQGLREKFHKLLFHEFIHTALGTSHAKNERHNVDNVDYAQACGDYCFKQAGIDTELTKKSRRICSGEFSMERGNSEDYARVMKRIKEIR